MFELVNLLSQPLECRDDRYAPPYPGKGITTFPAFEVLSKAQGLMHAKLTLPGPTLLNLLNRWALQLIPQCSMVIEGTRLVSLGSLIPLNPSTGPSAQACLSLSPLA